MPTILNQCSTNSTSTNFCEILKNKTNKCAYFLGSGAEIVYTYADEKKTSQISSCSPIVRLCLAIEKPISAQSYCTYLPGEADIATSTLLLSNPVKQITHEKCAEEIQKLKKWQTRAAFEVDPRKLIRDCNGHSPPPNVDVTRENPSEKDKHNGFHTIHRLYMAAAYGILDTFGEGRQGVAALIVNGSDGQILSWALKNQDVPALHAETSAILAYLGWFGGKLPANVRVYSTLKPCKMCAAWIKDYTADNKVKVYYGQDDPASAAQKTCLEQGGCSKLLNDRHGDVARGIALKGDAKTMATNLDEAFNKIRKSCGDGSAINFATSGDAKKIYSTSSKMLEEKIKKYGSDTNEQKNENVWKVLSYLTGYLSKIGVKTSHLDPPKEQR